MNLDLKILPIDLLKQYQADFDSDLDLRLNSLHESELSIENFSFYTSVSAVFSSKIEGEQIEMDSFIKHKRFGVKYQPDFTKKIDDLYDTYIFAQQSNLNIDNVFKAHGILTKHILHTSQQSKIRTGNMFVVTTDGRIEYVAANPYIVKSELEKLFADIMQLLKSDLNIATSFFFASLVHLVFVKIHPFEDGNGRIGRLLEKWFLAEKLGSKVWFIQSEKYYYELHETYYKNIRMLGLEYNDLKYSNAMPFLKMLPQSLLL
jgi:Fic family protein